MSRTFDHNYFNLPGTCACNEYSDCTNGKSGLKNVIIFSIKSDFFCLLYLKSSTCIFNHEINEKIECTKIYIKTLIIFTNITSSGYFYVIYKYFIWYKKKSLLQVYV